MLEASIIIVREGPHKISPKAKDSSILALFTETAQQHLHTKSRASLMYRLLRVNTTKTEAVLWENFSLQEGLGQRKYSLSLEHHSMPE